jgi:hypothetical protein
MAVSYLREYCGVSIPDVFHVSHSLDCKHNCSVIGPRVRIAFTEVIEPQEPLSKIIDLTCYESLESSNDSHSPSIPLQQTIANTDSESNGESEFAYQPKLDMGVLDNELGLQEREWERTQREQWEPYDFKLSDPRFHVYESNLTRVREDTAEGMDANDESSCLVTLSDVRQFVVSNLDRIRRLCRGEMMDSYITDRFSKICMTSLHKATSSHFHLFF